jgi:hypothetical protein
LGVLKNFFRLIFRINYGLSGKIFSVKKRPTSGPFSATEIIDLLRMKEISTIHKVKLGQDWLTVSDFIDQFEKGLLPEQNLEKVFEDEPEEPCEI